jgi:hypothetical protein
MQAMSIASYDSYSVRQGKISMYLMQISTVVIVFALSLVVERITEIVTTSHIFQPLRQFIAKWAFIDPTQIDPDDQLTIGEQLKDYFAYFIKCGYCFSVWVAAATAFVFPVDFVVICQSWVGSDSYFAPFINWAITSLVYHGLSNWIHVWFKRSQVGIVDVKDVKVVLEMTTPPPQHAKVYTDKPDAAVTAALQPDPLSMWSGAGLSNVFRGQQ